MSIRPGALIDVAAAPPAQPFDVLTDVMEQVRLAGTVRFSAELHALWGISIVRSGRAPFYAVTAGDGELQVGRRGAVRRVQAGDFVLPPNAAPHIVRSDRTALVLPFDTWLQTHPMARRGRTRHARPGVATRVTGGFCSGDPLRTNPLFGALPPVIHLRGTDQRVRQWLEPTLRQVETEIASGLQGVRTVLRRRADVLFIQAVRVHAGESHEAGWLRGLADARAGRALILLHERFAEPWTLATLARELGASRTLLAVRFKELVGESTMAYLTRWRITRAANLLHAAWAPLARVAGQAGYRSDAVFAKAFRRVTGYSPGAWRKLAPQTPAVAGADAATAPDPKCGAAPLA